MDDKDSNNNKAACVIIDDFFVNIDDANINFEFRESLCILLK